jgi:hypothetical protein
MARPEERPRPPEGEGRGRPAVPRDLGDLKILIPRKGARKGPDGSASGEGPAPASPVMHEERRSDGSPSGSGLRPIAIETRGRSFRADYEEVEVRKWSPEELEPDGWRPA